MKVPRAPGKWVDDLDASMPVTEAAERVLSVRLDGICTMLPLARDGDGDHPRVIHQLRVSTRRYEAALMVFRPCLREKKYRRMRKHVRRIRRAAGGARLCDVHAGIFAGEVDRAEQHEQEALQYVLQRILDERGEAQEDVDKVTRRYRGSRLSRKHRRLIKGLSSPGPDDVPPSSPQTETTLHDLARVELGRLVDRTESAGRDDLSIVTNLHELRIKIKRLRYGMELFASCFGPSFRQEVYPRVEALQERLGDINDTSEIIDQLNRYADELAEGRKPALRALRQVEDHEITQMISQLENLRSRFERHQADHVKTFRAWFGEFGLDELLGDLRRLLSPDASPDPGAEPGPSGRNGSAGGATSLASSSARAGEKKDDP